MTRHRSPLSRLCLQRLDRVLGDRIRLRGVVARPRRGALDLRVDYMWHDEPGARANTPLASAPQRCARVQATVWPWCGEGDGRTRRSLLIALAHIVGDMAATTGLGLGCLARGDGR